MAEQDMGIMMKAWERIQWKEGKRGPLPCDGETALNKLPRFTQPVMRALEKVGVGTAQEVTNECTAHLTIKQVSGILMTLSRNGMVNKVDMTARIYDPETQKTGSGGWLYEVAKPDEQPIAKEA